MSADLRGKLETDVETKAYAGKFHDMFSSRPHHIANIAPKEIQGCDLHEGDWGAPGAVIYWNYTNDGVPETAKEIIEVIDDDKYLTTYKVIEGHLLERFKSFVITIQATPKGTDGEGCIVHWTLEYEKLNADIEDPHTLLDLATAVTKHLEDHFLDQA